MGAYMHVYKYISRPICMYVVIYAYMQAYISMDMPTYTRSVFVCVLFVELAYVHIWKYISRHICMYVVIYIYIFTLMIYNGDDARMDGWMDG